MATASQEIFGKKFSPTERSVRKVSVKKAKENIVIFLGQEENNPRRADAFSQVARFENLYAQDSEIGSNGHPRATELPELTEHRSFMQGLIASDLTSYYTREVKESVRLAMELGDAIVRENRGKKGVVALRRELATELQGYAKDFSKRPGTFPPKLNK